MGKGEEDSVHRDVVWARLQQHGRMGRTGEARLEVSKQLGCGRQGGGGMKGCPDCMGGQAGVTAGQASFPRCKKQSARELVRPDQILPSSSGPVRAALIAPQTCKPTV